MKKNKCQNMLLILIVIALIFGNLNYAIANPYPSNENASRNDTFLKIDKTNETLLIDNLLPSEYIINEKLDRVDKETSEILLDIIFYENFEGIWPGDWYCVDEDPLSGEDYWGDSTYRACAGSWSGYCADESDVPGQYYDNYMWAKMYRAINLSDYDSAILSYYYWLDSETNYDYLKVGYYEDGSWYRPKVYNGNSGGWVYDSLSIPTTATWVGFLFESDGSITSEGAYVDEIYLIGEAEEAYLDVRGYNLDDDYHNIDIYIDGYYVETVYGVAPGAFYWTEYWYIVDPGYHDAEIQWYCEDCGMWHYASTTVYCPANEYTSAWLDVYYCEGQAYLDIRGYNLDDDTHDIEVYIDGYYLETINNVAPGAYYETAYWYSVTPNANHDAEIRWYCDEHASWHSESTSIYCPTGEYTSAWLDVFSCQGDEVQGIDVSHWQGDIDWIQVYSSGYRFAFVKATGGTGFVDDHFETNMNEGANAGMLVGAYHFAYPEYNTPEDEAAFFVSVAGDYLQAGYLRPVLDLEDDPFENSYPYRLGNGALANWIHSFMNAVESATGVTPMIYTNSNYANNYMESSLTIYDLWIAHWTYDPNTQPNTGIWNDWAFWQYSNLGSVPGIIGDVDLDIFNGDEVELNDYIIQGGQGVIIDAYWADSSGNEITNAFDGDTVWLIAETQNYDGYTATFDIYEDDLFPNPDDYVTTETATVGGGQASTTWEVEWQSDWPWGDPEFIFIVTIGSDSATSGQLTVPHTPDWTIMVYLDGDNNLEEYGINDFLEMASAGSTSNVNIVVQFDRIPGYDTRYDDWTTTKRYLVTSGMVPNIANALMDIGEANMGHPQTLIDFVTWTINNFSANHYCLILWDHGSGWRINGEVIKSVCSDDSSGGDAIEMDELGNALNMLTDGGNNPIDLIGFDACLMAMIEVGYEIAPYCNYMTASEETEPAIGWNYDDTLTVLTGTPTMSPQTLGAQFVSDYINENGDTLSTVNLGLYDDLRSDVSSLGASLQDNQHMVNITLAILLVETYYIDDFVDLYHFAELLQILIEDTNIDNLCQEVMDEVDNAVTSENHASGYTNSHGISIYVPWLDFDQEYLDLLFAQDSQWDEFLIWYHNNPPNTPTNSSPENGATDVDIDADLSWIGGDPDPDDIVTYDVYFGTINPPPLIASSHPTTTYNLGTMNYDMVYYWQIVSEDNHGAITNGPIWHFTTMEEPNQSPNANFIYSPSDPSTQDEIQFTDTSIDPDGTIISWSWDFGDGSTSTIQHPTHQYIDDGTYIVTLNVTDDDGATNESSQYIVVSNVGPIANFIYYPLFPTDLQIIAFTDNSTDSDGNIVSWLWDFEDGNTSLVQNPSHRYANNGTYNVTLAITDDDGATDSIIKTVTVTEAPPVLYNISGSVFYNGTGNGQIFVVLVEFVNGTQPINYTIISSPDSYILGATNGTYYLGAWMDINNDSFYDEEEPAGFAINNTFIQGPDPVDVNGGDVSNLNITLFAPPVVSDILDCTIDEGDAFVAIDLDNYVDDLDNDDNEITWTYSSNVELNIVLENRTATINIPNIDWYGSETVIFTATDPDGLNDSDYAIFTVISVNDPPVIITTDNTNATEDVLYYVDYEANDVENDTLNWILKTNATFLSINSSSGNLTGTPENADVGSYWVNVSVNDGNNGSDSHNFTLNVINVNDPPVVTDIPDEIILEGDNFTAFDLDDYVDDIDNSDSEISWIASGQTNLTITIDSNHIVNITIPHANWNGTETVTFNASDPEGLFDFDAATFIVTPVDIIEINETGVQNISWMNTTITIDVTAPTNITFAQYPQNPHPENTPYNSLNKYIDIDIENWSEVVNPPVTIKIYYTQNDLDDAGLTEDQLAGIHFWNGTAGEWQLYNDTGVNTTYQSGYEGYCWANAWHLTPLAPGGDNVPPSKVTGLEVTDAKDGKLRLSWTSAIDNVGVSHYKIYRDGGFLINKTATSHQDKDLNNGQSYSFQVSAVDTSGNEGEKSDSKSGTPTASGGGGSPGGGDPPSGPPLGPTNQKPVANVSAGEPYTGYVDEEITFDGSLSYDPDGEIVSWYWDFGDGGTGAGKTTNHSYSNPGTYNVTLTVTDDNGDTGTYETIVIIMQANRPPESPIVDGVILGNKTVEYNYTAVSTDPDNDTIRYFFDWDDGVITISGFLASGMHYNKSHDWMNSGVYTITVYAEDINGGVSGTTEMTVFIDVQFIDDVIQGYLLDTNDDGIYDIFHNNATGNETTVELQDNGNYLIDSDGDALWDYEYNLETSMLDTYTQLKEDEEAIILWLIALIVMVVISVIIFIYFVHLKKKEKDKGQKKKKAKSKKEK